MLAWDVLVEKRNSWQMLVEKIPFGLITIFFGWMTWQAQPSTNHHPNAFVLAATDDQLGLAKDSVALYTRWIDAKKPAELHVYAKGGHGFGMRKQNLPTDKWIERFGEWLDVQGLVPPHKGTE